MKMGRNGVMNPFGLQLVFQQRAQKTGERYHRNEGS